MLEIIIPAYNCADTICRTLDSLVAQTNQNFKCTVIDDCSSQDIKTIVDNYSDKLSIQYLRNDENRGVGMTRQRGIDETTSEYITFLDSDDILLPNAVDIWVNEIERNNPDAIHTQFLYDDGTKIDNEYCEWLFLVCHGKVYNSHFLKKYDISEDQKIKCLDDYYLNIQAFSLANKISIIPEPTYIYIKNMKSVTQRKGFLLRAVFEKPIAIRLAFERAERFDATARIRYMDYRHKANNIMCDKFTHAKEV